MWVVILESPSKAIVRRGVHNEQLAAEEAAVGDGVSRKSELERRSKL